MPSQVENGRTFEYAIATQLEKWASDKTPVELVRDETFFRCKSCYLQVPITERKRFDRAAFLPVETIHRLEPGLAHAKNKSDILYIRLCRDMEGQDGDVRDVILYRTNDTADDEHIWEIGISAKNNNDAAKHSRISEGIHFGEKWLNMNTSNKYKSALHSVFEFVRKKKQRGVETWNELGDEKEKSVYIPLLEAFIAEMKRLFSIDQTLTAQNLIKYLIGRKPFYKLIKNDRDNTSVLKVFNFVSGLGVTYNKVHPECKPQAIPLPSRCVEFALVDSGQINTAALIMDKGWQVNFRIHSAATKIETSLKFDVQLVGNPPALFTQHLF